MPAALRERLTSAWKRLRGGELSPTRASLSVAVGLFVGMLPVYGAQLLLVLLICVPFRLDAAVAYLAAHVSNPLTLPFLLAIEVEIGALLLTGTHASFDWKAASQVGVSGYALQIGTGAIVLGVVSAAAGAFATLALSGARKPSSPFDLALRRTLSRYSDAHVSHRMYARGKLENDPALRALSSMNEHFGRVTDAGSGIGQLGLCLLELGVVDSLVGFDPDPGSVALAQRAAREQAEFQCAGFSDAEWPEADTVLFIDSLHYTPIDVQNEALRRACASLRPGGRLIVRDVDARPGLRSFLTAALERLSVRLKGRRMTLAFRTSADLTNELTRLGLDCSLLPLHEWSPFENAIIVARKR